MKKILLALALVMLLGCAVPAVGETIINPDDKSVTYPVRTPANKGNNPVIEGEHPFTGLKAETDEERDALEHYTPIALVFDNNAEGYMHMGIGSADVIFQIPNQSTSNNKQLAVFASHFPVYAGGSRSARMTAFPLALAMDAAFVSAGFGPPAGMESGVVDFDAYRRKYKYNLDLKWFDRTSGRKYHHRAEELGAEKVWSNVGHIQDIRNDYLIAKDVQFEKRPFLFTDEPLTRGEIANVIDMKFYENSEGRGGTNENSDCTFRYEDGVGYTRDILKGTEFDRTTQEFLYFANVIVLRTPVRGHGVSGTDYKYY